VPLSYRAPVSVSSGDADHVGGLYRQIYGVVRAIPAGAVATYGQVAQLAGIPRGHRVAGAAMRLVTPPMGIPWHRVVGRRSRTMAQINIKDPIGGALQRRLLEAEGVWFTRTGGIRLRDHGWLPVDP